MTGFSCKLLQLNNCAGFNIGTTLSTLWEAFSSGLRLNFFGSCFIKIRLESFRLCRTFFYITNLNLILMLECHSIANLNLATFNQSMFGCKFVLKLCIKCMIIRPIVTFLSNLTYVVILDFLTTQYRVCQGSPLSIFILKYLTNRLCFCPSLG